MTIDVKVHTPLVLEGFTGDVVTEGKFSIRRQCIASGDENDRLVFRRCYEQMCGILAALEEINCNGVVDCSIDNGTFAVNGHVNVWFAPAERVVAQSIRELCELGSQAARISRDSHIEMHALIVKTALRKVA